MLCQDAPFWRVSEMIPRPSGLAAAERYALQAQILSDPELSEWFLAVCANKTPVHQPDEATLALLEAAGIIRANQFGITLGPEGRVFAQSLGLAPPPSSVELREAVGGSPPRGGLKALWRTFLETRDQVSRNRLAEHYLPMVRSGAEGIHSKLPQEVDIEDLMSAGIFGLLDALDSFGPGLGVTFEAYATPRIRGAILDELRRMDWVPGVVRSRSSKLSEVQRRLRAELGRDPTDSEIADALRILRLGSASLNKDTRAMDVAALWKKVPDAQSAREGREGRPVRAEQLISATTEADTNDLAYLIEKSLTTTERLILVFYYYEQMTMSEIGHALDLSESRVSQMHASIIARLRFRLKRLPRESAS